jgi:hypothetical protein
MDLLSTFLAGGGIAIASAFITVLGTYGLERLRWRHEKKLRFNQQQQQQAYTRFLSIIDLERQTPNRTPEEDRAMRREEFTQAQAELMVLASPPPVREGLRLSCSRRSYLKTRGKRSCRR